MVAAFQGCAEHVAGDAAEPAAKDPVVEFFAVCGHDSGVPEIARDIGSERRDIPYRMERTTCVC
jgi:hypothetical protein